MEDMDARIAGWVRELQIGLMARDWNTIESLMRQMRICCVEPREERKDDALDRSRIADGRN